MTEVTPYPGKHKVFIILILLFYDHPALPSCSLYVPLLYTEMVQYSYFPRRAKIMKIAMASDHGGFALKASLMKHLDEREDRIHRLRDILGRVL